MIDVVVADDQDLYRVGMVEILAAADNVRIVGQAESPAQLLRKLQRANPHVLILSTTFLPELPKIKRILERRRTVLLVLAEENDQTAYIWIGCERTGSFIARLINPLSWMRCAEWHEASCLCRNAVPTQEKIRPRLPKGGRKFFALVAAVRCLGFARCAMSACHKRQNGTHAASSEEMQK